MILERPKDGGNLADIKNPLKNRSIVILESDVLKQMTDNSVAGTTYVGKAKTGSGLTSPVWQISRTVEVSSVSTTTWADGDGFFDNVWGDRTGLTYK